MPRTSDILRYSIIVIVIGFASLFALSVLRKRREHKLLLTEMEAVVSEASYYRQFYPDDAKRTLLQAMHMLHRAELGGDTPGVFLNEVFDINGDSFLDRASDGRRPRLKRSESLAIETLLANYENCRKLGFITNDQALSDLKAGTAPTITNGPTAGERADVRPIIDPELSPGIDKIIANLEIVPPRPDDARPDDVEIAKARQLARDLQYAGIIESAALKRIENSYDEVGEGETPTDSK